MNTDPFGRPARGLGRYVRAVADELGLPPVCATYELDVPTTAYIALEHRSRRYRGHELMLVWHEEHGWAVAVETDPGDPSIVLAYVGGRVLPRPDVLAASVRALLVGGAAGRADPPVFRRADGDDLDDLLAAHAPRSYSLIPD